MNVSEPEQSPIASNARAWVTSSEKVTFAVGYTAHLICVLLTVKIITTRILISIMKMKTHELFSLPALKVLSVLEELVAYFP